MLKTPPKVDVDHDVDLKLFEQMAFIRAFEERVGTLYRQGKVRGPTHLALGHEAIAVGVGSVLEPRDSSIGTYRGHHHALVRGAPPDKVMLELLGREGGICRGKGGSMHITSVEHGYWGSHAIIGAQMPIAVGLAWASKLRGQNSVTACFFGDGATNIGAFHEAVNLAAVWQLPVLFVCEHNGYMEYTPIELVTPVAHPAADRASAYGLEPVKVDGNDVVAVRAAAQRAAEKARNGGGPTLIEARTYRFGGHSVADPATYRPPGELERWQERDPLVVHRDGATARGVPAEQLEAILQEQRVRADDLAREALEAPEPDTASAWEDVWSDRGTTWRN